MLWCQKNIQGPAAAAGHRLYGIHINMIEVGPLLAVDFYVDEILFMMAAACWVFKTFPFHYVAPVTGGIADADKYRLIFIHCSFQRFLAPGIPVYRIMRMLKQIRTCFAGKPVAVFSTHEECSYKAT